MRQRIVKAAAFVLIALVLMAVTAACGSDSKTLKAETDAVRNVFSSSRGMNPWHMFFSRPGSVHCHLDAGGTLTRVVPATCDTRAAVNADGSSVVTLEITFTWGGNTDHHYWKFWLSRPGRIVHSRVYGDPLYPIYTE